MNLKSHTTNKASLTWRLSFTVTMTLVLWSTLTFQASVPVAPPAIEVLFANEDAAKLRSRSVLWAIVFITSELIRCLSVWFWRAVAGGVGHPDWCSVLLLTWDNVMTFELRLISLLLLLLLFWWEGEHNCGLEEVWLLALLHDFVGEVGGAAEIRVTRLDWTWKTSECILRKVERSCGVLNMLAQWSWGIHDEVTAWNNWSTNKGPFISTHCERNPSNCAVTAGSTWTWKTKTHTTKITVFLDIT